MTDTDQQEEKRNLILRLEAEHASVNERYRRLDQFILSDKYGRLPEVDRIDLSAQWRHMKGYLEVLERRIDRLKGVLIGV